MEALDQNVVEVYADSVTYLLCGKAPFIGQHRKRSVSPEVEEKTANDIRLALFPPEIAAYSKSNRPVAPKTQLTSPKPPPPSKSFDIKSDMIVFNKAEDYLHTYQENSERRKYQKHAEWEDTYMKPLHERTRARVNGTKYSHFKKESFRPESMKGECPQLGTLIEDAPVHNVYIRVPTAGLEDRIHKYVKYRDNESKLTTFIQKANGEYIEPQTKFSKNIHDDQTWKVLPETRFLTPNPNILPPKGRKIFAQKYHSHLKKELDQF